MNLIASDRKLEFQKNFCRASVKSNTKMTHLYNDTVTHNIQDDFGPPLASSTSSWNIVTLLEERKGDSFHEVFEWLMAFVVGTVLKSHMSIPAVNGSGCFLEEEVHTPTICVLFF